MTETMPMTTGQRRMALEDLARMELEPWVQGIMLAALSPLEGEGLREAWETLREDVALLDGLESRPWAQEVTWESVNHELRGPDRWGDALDEMHGRIAGDLDRLTGGTR
jgi:hypothetical protein